MSPARVQSKRGSKLPPNTKLVTRSTKFGNRYVVGAPGIPDRRTAVARFRADLAARRRGQFVSLQMRSYPSDETIRAELGGYDLACACPVDDEPCHVDVLLPVANPPRANGP